MAAAGNANNYNGVGDTYSDSGSPANAAAALSVANAYGSTQPIDRARVTTKTGLEWLQGDYSVNFDYSKASADQLRGEVLPHRSVTVTLARLSPLKRRRL